jgi:hypothetical protein
VPPTLNEATRTSPLEAAVGPLRRTLVTADEDRLACEPTTVIDPTAAGDTLITALAVLEPAALLAVGCAV